MKNKSTLIGFALIAAILFGWMYFMSPSKEERERQMHIQDSIRQARIEQARVDSIKNAERQQQAEALAQVADSVATQEMDSATLEQHKADARRDKYGIFAGASQGEEQTWTIENKYQKLTFNSKGGFLKKVELKDYYTYGEDSLHVIMFDTATIKFDLSFFAQNLRVNTSQFYFEPYMDGQPYAGQPLTVADDDSLVFALRLPSDDPQRYLEYVYTIHGDNYMMDFDIRTVGLKDVIASNVDFMSLDWAIDMMKQEKSTDRFADESVYYRALNDKDVDHLKVNKDVEEDVSTKLKWISFKQRFFCNVIVAKEGFNNAKMAVATRESDNPRYYKSMAANISIPYDKDVEVNTIPMSLYFGPNHFKTLRSYKLGLQDQINLGSFFLIRWINYGVIAVFNWLKPIGVMWNYGIVILILTLIIKTLLFPLAFKSYKSSAITRVLKPEMQAINEKYPKEEDAMKKQQAVLNLQRQAGVSPASGCLPALLQFPILIAIFRFFPASIELRQQPFLWAEDLSTYDSIVEFPKFLGMDHLSLCTILMTITTLIYTFGNNKQMDVSSNPQMKPMKWMMYLMPIMFFAIFNNYSAGLSYYYMLVNIITFIQMFIFRKMINEDKVRATIEKNKKKPQKKSGFMKRLEEAQKQQAKLQQQKKR